MSNQVKKAVLWIIGTMGGILLIYVAIFTISVIPTIILSPFIVFEIIRENGWTEISLYYKLVIICGSLIFIGIAIKEFWLFVKWIKEKME